MKYIVGDILESEEGKYTLFFYLFIQQLILTCGTRLLLSILPTKVYIVNRDQSHDLERKGQAT